MISNRSQEFLAQVRDQVLPSYMAARGILSIAVLQRVLIGYNEIIIFSLWESPETAREFVSKNCGNETLTKELGVIQKEPINFEVVSIWSSEESGHAHFRG